MLLPLLNAACLLLLLLLLPLLLCLYDTFCVFCRLRFSLFPKTMITRSQPNHNWTWKKNLLLSISCVRHRAFGISRFSSRAFIVSLAYLPASLTRSRLSLHARVSLCVCVCASNAAVYTARIWTIASGAAVCLFVYNVCVVGHCVSSSFFFQFLSFFRFYDAQCVYLCHMLMFAHTHTHTLRNILWWLWPCVTTVARYLNTNSLLMRRCRMCATVLIQVCVSERACVLFNSKFHFRSAFALAIRVSIFTWCKRDVCVCSVEWIEM